MASKSLRYLRRLKVTSTSSLQTHIFASGWLSDGAGLLNSSVNISGWPTRLSSMPKHHRCYNTLSTQSAFKSGLSRLRLDNPLLLGASSLNLNTCNRRHSSSFSPSAPISVTSAALPGYTKRHNISPLVILDNTENSLLLVTHLPSHNQWRMFSSQPQKNPERGTSEGIDDPRPQQANHRAEQQNHSQNIPNSSPKDGVAAGGENANSGDDSKKITLYQRFKKTYKEHGKVLVVVHLITSSIWLGSFYTAARCGIDVVPYLESWNFSERVIAPFKSGGLGDLALAYLMYKLATPARYTVTIAGTNFAIRYLKKEGKMREVPKEDSLRSLYKEGKEDLKRHSKTRMKRINRRRMAKQNEHK